MNGLKHSRQRIALVTMAPFPIGNVSTIRFTSYLNALVKKGVWANVIVYSPTSMAKHIKTRAGIDNGIHYQYATKITWGKHTTIITKLYYLLLGLFSTLKIINTSKVNTVILYGDNPLIVNLTLKFGSILLNYRLIGDRSEYPTVKQRKSKLKMAIYKLKNRILDGMIVMTRELNDFYAQILRHTGSTFLLPMTMDMRRFDHIKSLTTTDPYIAVVFGVHNRDGLYESIQSYIRYKDLGGTYRLKIIGDFYSMPNKSKLLKLIDSTNYPVEIVGKKPITEIPSILANASCLLTTPNEYISGGFPTKLGEYMLSGVPVVATRVGELDQYTTHMFDIIFAERGDIDGIANSIFWVNSNIQEAKKIAENARQTAQKKFSAETYVDGFQIFLFQ